MEVFINIVIVAGITAGAIVVYMLLANWSQSRRILANAAILKEIGEPDADEHEIVDPGKLEKAHAEMVEKLYAEVGEDGRVETQQYRLLNGKIGLIGNAWKRRKR